MIISTTLRAFSAGLFWSESGNLKVLDGSPMNSGCFFSLCLELLMCRQEKRNVFLIYCWSSIVSQQKTFGLLYLRLSLKKASKATMFLSRSWSLKKAFFRLHMTRVFPCFWKAFQELFSIELKGFSPPDILLFQTIFFQSFWWGLKLPFQRGSFSVQRVWVICSQLALMALSIDTLMVL